MCMRGPPWTPGKTLRLMSLLRSGSLVMMRPPLGPRSDLWVVVVTMWAWGKGDGCSPAATNPAMCAMSAMRIAPTSSAISRNFLKSICLG